MQVRKLRPREEMDRPKVLGDLTLIMFKGTRGTNGR